MKTLILIFSFLVSLHSWANQNDDESWSEPGSNPKQMQFIMDTMKMSAECRPYAEKIEGQMGTYLTGSRYYLWGDRKEFGQHMMPALESIKGVSKTLEDQNHSCFEEVAVFYGLNSLRVFKTQDFIRTRIALLALYRMGKLKPLSKATRASWNGAWSKRNERSGAYQILGAYDCATTTIYFDPHVPPADVAGILSHEFAHLMRDKFLAATNLPIREQVLLDEAVASIFAGLQQLIGADAYFSNTDLMNVPEFNYDYSLFSRQGELQKIFYDWRTQTNEAQDSFGEFFQHVFGSSPQNMSSLKSILGVIAGGYFPGEKTNISGIGETLQRFPFARLDSRLIMSSQRIFTPRSARELILQVQEHADQPSRSCQDFLAASRSGQLGKYVGLEVHLGSEGVKPGSEGTKPGSEGTKPGSEGTKPGSEGVKPSTAVRACILPAKGI